MMRLRKSQTRCRRARANPRYADPWRFRRQGTVEHVAGMNGRPLPDRVFRRGNVLINAAVDDRDSEGSTPRTTSMLPELRRRVSAEIARYRMSGMCSTLDIELVEALWQDGKSLRAYARERKVSPAAIGDHIERLRFRCVRFYLFWLWKNRGRRGHS